AYRRSVDAVCIAAKGASGNANAHNTVAPTNARASVAEPVIDGNGTLSAMKSPSSRQLFAVGLISATLLMTELALTRIFSVIMYYHFAFLAISIALFGLSASGVFAYVNRKWLDRHSTQTLLASESLIYAVATVVALFALVRLRVGLNYSPTNLALILTIYALAALPFFT